MITELSEKLIKTFEAGNKVLICGNGGSSAQASHFAEELVGKYQKIRKALPAIALNDPQILTAIGNDFGFPYVFSRQVEGLGKEGDLLVGISTSGMSINVNNALLRAQELGLQVIDWPRIKGNSGEIQAYQMTLMHAVVEIIEVYYAGT